MIVPELNCTIEVNHPVFIGGTGQEPVSVDLSPERPAFVTGDGVAVWMERIKQRTRYLDGAGNQVGPWHQNFVPAIVWARAQGWRDPSLPEWFNDAVIAEVAAGGSARQEGQR